MYLCQATSFCCCQGPVSKTIFYESYCTTLFCVTCSIIHVMLFFLGILSASAAATETTLSKDDVKRAYTRRPMPSSHVVGNNPQQVIVFNLLGVIYLRHVQPSPYPHRTRLERAVARALPCPVGLTPC